MKPDNPIILALDYSDLNEAAQMLGKVRPHIGMVKIGLELFTANGRNAIDMAGSFNIPIFLDIKLNDVPTTVAKTTDVVCSLLGSIAGEHLLSVHCNGGATMCREAMKAAHGSNVTIAGVTVLTSLEYNDFRDMGFGNKQPGDRTVVSADIGYDCLNEDVVYNTTGARVYNGLRHFICAPNQIPLMKKYFEDAHLITPGIRSSSEEANDHQRTKPIGFALSNGATWVVIGRPITKASDPVIAAQYFEQQAKKYG
jgi:orotidine-5'-phosphate decarboxylase